MNDTGNNQSTFWIYAFSVAIIVGLISGLSRVSASRQRALKLKKLKTQLGFDSFNPNRNEEFAKTWGFLSRLGQDEGRYAFNILRGRHQQQQVFIFDYHYQLATGKITRGKSTEHHNLTLLMLVMEGKFPRVTISPESLGRSKITTAFGIGEDIKLESAEFSRKFCVRSLDRKFGYGFCNPRMMEYLLANPDLQIEIQGSVVLIAFEPQLPVRKIQFNLQRLTQIRSLMPEYLFTQNT